MQFLQKEWVKNQPTPTFDKEPKEGTYHERMVLFLLGTYFTASFFMDGNFLSSEMH